MRLVQMKFLRLQGKLDAAAQAYSAKEPLAVPKTASPVLMVPPWRDRFNYPGNVSSEPRKLRPGHSDEQADERWRAAQ